MAYTVQKLRASALNTDQARITSLETRVGCTLRRAAAQSINNNSATVISWDTEDEDTHGFITVTGPTITIPTGYAGVYSMTFKAISAVNFASTTRLLADLTITPAAPLANYPSFFRAYSNTAEDANPLFVSLSGVPLTAGSTITFTVFHIEGSAQNFTAWCSLYRTGL